MDPTSAEHHIRIGDATVGITGRSGLVEATWALWVDDRRVDEATRSGTFTLRGELPDGSTVEAVVTQGAFGGAEVVVGHDGQEVTRFRDIVL